MMYSANHTGGWIWLHIHWFFVALAMFGFLAGLIWLIKHASKKEFKQIFAWTAGIGVIGLLLTAPLALSGWDDFVDDFSHCGTWNSDTENEMAEFMTDFFDDNDVESMEEHMDEMMEEMEEILDKS
jgi:hypothetical protein